VKKHCCPALKQASDSDKAPLVQPTYESAF